MHNRGKLVVLSLFAVAVAMAGFALWWNWGQGRRSLEFWGTEGGLAIRDATHVQISKLKTTAINESTEISKFVEASHMQPRQSKTATDKKGAINIEATIVTDVQLREVLETKDVTDAHGLVHARHAFLEDASFKWDDSVSYFGPNWQYAVRFQSRGSETIVLLDLKTSVVGANDQKRAARLSPKTASGWKVFISRYFPDEDPMALPSSPAKAR